MTTITRPRVRCAIYTRKSSEEGLEQSFNSLQAQREACEAYIASQRQEGWHAISKKYDDGGFSGGNMNRPALKQLLDDIDARLVDTVVVYKVDRLTRSLMDFSKIIEAFDQKAVSFVSVTQQFNTTSSMGRLTLNVLLSFAQFEREVTGERIRDKIAASKKKGMWMGGVVPLGYDLKGRKLVVNAKEAKIVEEIFEQYLTLGSVAELKRYLDGKRIRTKIRTSVNGRTSGGERYSRGGLYKLLKNEVYIGKIAHCGHSYDGQHPAILSPETWEKASTLLQANNQGQRRPGRTLVPSLLAGLVFDSEGNRYTPTHAVKGGRRYRYYTSQAVIHKRKKSSYLDRLPAKELEQLISVRVQNFIASPEELSTALHDSGFPESNLAALMESARTAAANGAGLLSMEAADVLRGIVRQVELCGSEVRIRIDLRKLIAYVLGEFSDADRAQSAPRDSVQLFTISAPFAVAHRRRELRLLVPGTAVPPGKGNTSTLRAFIRAQRWKQHILDGEPIARNNSQAKLSSTQATLERYCGWRF